MRVFLKDMQVEQSRTPDAPSRGTGPLRAEGGDSPKSQVGRDRCPFRPRSASAGSHRPSQAGGDPPPPEVRGQPMTTKLRLVCEGPR